jgi:hypothetical protein
MASSSLHITLLSVVSRRHLIRSKLSTSALHRVLGDASAGWSSRQQHSQYWQEKPSTRYFSKTSNGNEPSSKQPVSKSQNNNNNNNSEDNDEVDPFGVFFEDGSDLGKLGPRSPPRYKRDPVTGKFTGEQEIELTKREKKLLNMDRIEEQEYLLDKVMKEWNIDDKDDRAEPEKLSKLAKRIQEDNMGMNTLGRSVESQAFRGKLEDGGDAYVDKSGFSKPLTPAEFNVFQKHMEQEYNIPIDNDDIPVEPTNQRGDESILGGYADTEELNSKWMSSSAMRFMDDSVDDDPFSDLLPSDLSPTRLVNRRKAKPIPRQLLHHNNLALLRRHYPLRSNHEPSPISIRCQGPTQDCQANQTSTPYGPPSDVWTFCRRISRKHSREGYPRR